MLDVIALGEILIDFTPAGRSEQEQPLFEQNPGGAPANVLCGLAKMGRRTSFIGAAGDDPLGHFLVSVLDRAGVGRSGLALMEGVHTTMAFVHLNDQGDRTFRFVRGADTLVSGEGAERELAAGCRIFHFGTLSMTHDASAGVTLAAVRQAQQTGALISFDPNLRISLWHSPDEAGAAIRKGLQVADIVKLSEEELRFAAGTDDVRAGAERLLSDYAAIRLILVTLGERGCLLCTRGASARVPGFRVNAIDTTGAGDACMAGLLDRLLDGAAQIESLDDQDLAGIGRFANAMGALATTRRGGIPAMPALQEIEDLLNHSEDDALNDKYRPHFHFTPPAQWMNDPNGLVYFEGEYHLFYQHHPQDSVWGPMHWGHAISRDLIRWEHQPVALAPDANGMIFSGCAVVDRRDTSGLFGGGAGLVAIFTHADTYLEATADGGEAERPRQRQSVAYSMDKGRSWTMYAGNPVLADPGIADFRDPKVFWHEPDGRWVMVIAAGDHIRFYTSPDLLSWTYASAFGHDAGCHEGVWECPDLFRMPVEGEEGAADRFKWVLLVSIGDGRPEGSKTQYFLGTFDGTSFAGEGEELLWLDEGRDNYAGVTWSDVPEADGRRILIGWMSNWKYANATPTEGWRGAMTIPRTLTLKDKPDGVRLCQQPVAELAALRGEASIRGGIVLDSAMWSEEQLTGDAYEIEAVFEPLGAGEFGFRVRRSGDGAEETVIGYIPAESQLFVDRTRSGEAGFSEAFPVRHGALLRPEADGTVRIRVLVDRCSVEAFGGDGEAALTDLIYPDPESVGLTIYAAKGAAKVRSLRFCALGG
ncbi:PfkB family carbohydrate kinase [Cohnella sp. 56]|uniref:PfkB family carbohydrate kinase n=1 Tax=Cohnella sp. 56 TaxID=3113722 RepID=UPI0030E97EE8